MKLVVVKLVMRRHSPQWARQCSAYLTLFRVPGAELELLDNNAAEAEGLEVGVGVGQILVMWVAVDQRWEEGF